MPIEAYIVDVKELTVFRSSDISLDTSLRTSPILLDFSFYGSSDMGKQVIKKPFLP